MLRFRCPKCNAKMEVDESFAGRSARCPTCGYDFRVPKTGDQTPVHGVVEPARPGATTVRIQGESVELLPPLETTALVALVLVCLSVVVVLAASLNPWLPIPWHYPMVLGAMLALLGAFFALSAYNNILRSRGHRRGKPLALAALACGGGLFLVFVVGAIVGFVLASWRPPCEKNLEVISIALGNYARAHDGAFPDGHKTSLRTLVEEGYLGSADYLTCPTYPGVPGAHIYDLTPDVNNRDFPPETMLVADRPPLDTHKDGMVRILLVSGKVILVPVADWQKYRTAQETKWNDVLNRIRRAKADAVSGGAPATPEITPPAPATPAGTAIIAPPAPAAPATPAGAAIIAPPATTPVAPAAVPAAPAPKKP